MEEEVFGYEDLVPIRVNVSTDHGRVQDAFTWNLSESRMTPEQFSSRFCKEMDFDERIEQEIAASIAKQIDDFKELKRRTHLDENIFLIRIDLTINGISLYDQFEWDISSPLNNPESFSRSLCADMGLSREFETAIAHCIREQIYFYERALSENKAKSVEYYHPGASSSTKFFPEFKFFYY
eukprot:TRINITY_DN21952_c0_g1_i2.p1 TRINITY_DN21952_c0_g1~~TRINITY_DN21952_c0_g1_i2.p1  ORF type:complete len:181 (-),score=20.25 TRINITY_DN21952_c0_g1_i2:47-589(-)